MERKTKAYGLLVVVFTTLTLLTIAGGILYISALYTATTHDDGLTVVSENVAQTPSGNNVSHLVVKTPDGNRYQCLTTNGPGGMTCDWGNSEIYFSGTHMDVTIEALNHSTVTVTIPLDHELTEGEIDSQIRKEMGKVAMDFDAEETFEELWSPEFSEHNNMSAFTFVKILQEDEEFFQELATRL